MNAPLLEFDGVEKEFFGVKVLKGVSFRLMAGQVLGLVGENGAGKSTLMNILGGNLKKDAGRIRFEGVDFQPLNPQDADRKGIAFIHQELNLFPNLTIAENLFLTRLPRVGFSPFVDRAAIERQATQLLSQVGIEAPTHQLMETLSAGERQLVEIAKALSIDARLIIFDEPTTSLSSRETERLFDLIGRLQAGGVGIIYISHNLEDVFRLCDGIVVLRDGAVVGNGSAADFDNEKLISLLVGRSIHQIFPERQSAPGAKTVLEAKAISQPGVVENISFSLKVGEVLGLAGLMGAGRSELARILFGLDPMADGQVFLNGELVQQNSPRHLMQRGLGFLTENRRDEGLCLDASVAENLALATLPRYSATPCRWLSLESINSAIERVRSLVLLDPKAANAQPVRTLRGGNQQKVVLGKWLLHEPRVLILDEPTRGIDVGAKFEIYRLIRQLAEKGTAILVISSEIEELMGLCDRILVMRRGELVDEFLSSNFNRERILRAALGAVSEGGK